jgi:glyoxylase-like metal-dependent hydrolase (beta-lactamase superfamily II)
VRTIKLGSLVLSVCSDGVFWLDGGAMFGVVPKVLWNKLNQADEHNRIKLALNCLLVQTTDKILLLDTGVGGELKDRFKEMYRVERTDGLIEALYRRNVQPEDIDYVINTHLHFDHCGGNTMMKNGTFVPTFPRAKYVIQKQEWKDAMNPNERTRASYLKEKFEPLEKAGQLMIVEGEQEITAGVRVITTAGHTKGHQSVILESNGEKAVYLGDLIPTTSHIKLPYVMGYDLYPLDVISKKKELLEIAIREHWLLIFEHDPDIPFAYLIEESGKPVLKPA